MATKDYKLDPIFKINEPIKYAYNKKKEDWLQIAPVEGSTNQFNAAGGRIEFQVNSLSNWLLLSDSYIRCDFKLTNNAGNAVPVGNITLENNFFPTLFSEVRLEAGSKQIENLTNPGEYDTMLKLVMYPSEKYDNDSGWIPDTGNGEIMEVTSNDAIADANRDNIIGSIRNRTRNEPNTGFQMRKNIYNNTVGNSYQGYINWKLSPLIGFLDHRKVSSKLPYKLTLVRDLNNNKIFYGAAGSQASLSITKMYLYIKTITPIIEVETKLLQDMNKTTQISFLRRNTIASSQWSSSENTWNITTTNKPSRYILLGFKQLADALTNNNNRYWIKDANDRILQLQVRLNNENYPNNPLTIEPNVFDYNELYRNYKDMCEHFGNIPQVNFNDFINNYPIFCIDLSAHPEDIFKTGVQLSVYVKKHSSNAAHSIRAFCLILEEAELSRSFNNGITRID